MPRTKYVTFKSWAGFVVRPSAPVVVDASSPLTLVRAAVLTAQMEGAHWGTVQTYDGVGFSAGLLHHIAYDRRGNQSSGLRLLARLPEAPWKILEMIAAEGWVLGPDGLLRDAHDGRIVALQMFRDRVNGSYTGLTPKRGPDHDRARRWAETLHSTMADPRSRDAQLEHACAWLAGGHAALELGVYQRHGAKAQTMRDALASDVGPVVDCAMAVYHAFSANAPSIAQRFLRTASAQKTPDGLLRALCGAFRASTYGNWKARYVATKKAAARLSAAHGWGWPALP